MRAPSQQCTILTPSLISSASASSTRPLGCFQNTFSDISHRKHAVHDIRCDLLHVGNHMRIDAERNRDVCMLKQHAQASH
jgi:hypothetical protein